MATGPATPRPITLRAILLVRLGKPAQVRLKPMFYDGASTRCRFSVDSFTMARRFMCRSTVQSTNLNIKAQSGRHMAEPLRVLYIADDGADAVAAELRQGGYEPSFERVTSEERLQKACWRKGTAPARAGALRYRDQRFRGRETRAPWRRCGSSRKRASTCR